MLTPTSPPSLTHYRQDIDGLRALAILGVVLHHYGVGFVPAGYIGVDIFFVISGFLIGGIILRGAEAQNFLFRKFYRRRILRILPALMIMLLITTILAWIFMLPNALRYYGGGLLTAILSLSNIWFYNRIDYFNPDTHLEPLIHTWSLGVEEQFYLFAPLIILAIWRFGRRIELATTLLVALSFTIMVVLAQGNPDAAFYLPFGRFWELLAGLMAYRLRPTILQRYSGFSHWIQGAAGVMIIGFMVFYTSPIWPDFMAFIPVFGTVVLLVLGDQKGPTRFILTLRPIVFIGLISYSLYLYHQPILVFTRIAYPDLNPMLFWAVVVPPTFLLSVLSWRFVERPFRSGDVPILLRRVVLLVLPLALVGFAVGGHITKGYPNRLSPDLLEIVGYAQSYAPTYKKCLPDRKDIASVSAATACVHGAAVQPDVAIWGDSHAAVFAYSLGAALKMEDRAVMELTMSSCTPIVGLYRKSLNRGETCVTRNDDVMAYLLATNSLKTVILDSSWAHNIEAPWELEPLGGWKTISSPDDYRLAVIDHLRQQIKKLTESGKTVILMYPIPFAPKDPPEAFARLVVQKGSEATTLEVAYSDFRAAQAVTFQTFDALGDINGLVRVFPHTSLCAEDKNECLTVDKRRPLYFDAGHLSLAGVERIVPILLDALHQRINETWRAQNPP